MKKKIIAFSSVFVIAVVGVLTYLLFPKNQNNVFELSVNNINVVVGESEKIDYTVSVKDAVITMQIENLGIAKITSNLSEYFVTGISAGKTSLKLKGNYCGEKIEKTVSITVISNSAYNGDNGNENQEELKIEFVNFMNCDYENDSFLLTAGQKAFFTVVFNINVENYVLKSDSDKLEIEKAHEIGNNTYSMKSSEAGEFQISVSIKGKIKTFKVVAN